MTDQNTSTAVISKGRLEMLFDGIFTISMTILVLDLKVPDLVDRHSIHELSHALARNAPTFISYLLTFLMLGMFWYRHNQHYHKFRVITRSMLVLHLVQLAAAAFFPFCAALIGRYPGNGLSSVVYVGCVLVYAWAAMANWIVAWKSGSLNPDVTEADYLRSRKRSLRGCLVLSSMFIIYLVNVLMN